MGGDKRQEGGEDGSGTERLCQGAPCQQRMSVIVNIAGEIHS